MSSENNPCAAINCELDAPGKFAVVKKEDAGSVDGSPAVVEQHRFTCGTAVEFFSQTL